MRPDPLGGPGSDEEDSGWLRVESRKRAGNEEMRRGVYSVTDLRRDKYTLSLVSCFCACVYVPPLTTMDSYDWPLVLGEGGQSR